MLVPYRNMSFAREIHFILSALMLVLVVLVPKGHASPIKYNYSGYITSRDDYNNTGIANIIDYGTKLSGTIEYDPKAPFQHLIEPGRGLFLGPSDPININAGPIHLTSNNAEVQLFDDYNGLVGNDMLFLPSVTYDQSGFPPELQGFVTVVRLQFDAQITNMSLPNDLTDLYPVFFWITSYSASAAPPSYFSWQIGGHIESLAPDSTVPEPSSLLLVGIGLIGTALHFRKKDKA